MKCVPCDIESSVIVLFPNSWDTSFYQYNKSIVVGIQTAVLDFYHFAGKIVSSCHLRGKKDNTRFDSMVCSILLASHHSHPEPQGQAQQNTSRCGQSKQSQNLPRGKSSNLSPKIKLKVRFWLMLYSVLFLTGLLNNSQILTCSLKSSTLNSSTQ